MSSLTIWSRTTCSDIEDELIIEGSIIDPALQKFVQPIIFKKYAGLISVVVSKLFNTSIT